MSDERIQVFFRSTVLVKLVYASPAWSGFCYSDDDDDDDDDELLTTILARCNICWESW